MSRLPRKDTSHSGMLCKKPTSSMALTISVGSAAVVVTPPPMLFEELAAAELPASIRPQVEELLRLKRETPEIGTGPRVDALNAFIEQESASLDAVVATLVPHVEKDWDTLDQVFWKLLGVSGEGNA